jgi:hypothetical protein
MLSRLVSLNEGYLRKTISILIGYYRPIFAEAERLTTVFAPECINRTAGLESEFIAGVRA